MGWHGQTPGKRLAGTRVVRLDGGGPGFLDVAIRNLVRLVDFLPFAYALGFVVMFFNRNARRLGDFAAGTLVIRQPEVVHLESIARTAPRLAPGVPPPPAGADALLAIPTIRRLSGDDYHLVCTLLDRRLRGEVSTALMVRLARALSARLGTPLPGPTEQDAQRFLATVAEAYRQAAD